MAGLAHTTDVFGVTRVNPTREDLELTLSTLEDADIADYPDVALVWDEDNHFVFSESGVFLHEKPVSEKTRFIQDVEASSVLSAWESILKEGPSALDHLPWAEEL